MMKKTTQICGHRGAMAVEPENTLRSFRAAIDAGVEWIEFDIQLSMDKVLIVIHDPTIDRTTDGKGNVSDYGVIELKQFDAGKGEKLLTLEELFKFMKSNSVKMQIELKAKNAEKAVVALIEKYNYLDRVIIISFWHEFLVRCKLVNPKVKTGCLLASRPIDLLHVLSTAKAEYLSIAENMVDKNLIELMHKNGKKVICWTINDSAHAKEKLKTGVDILCTNNPKRIIEALK